MKNKIFLFLLYSYSSFNQASVCPEIDTDYSQNDIKIGGKFENVATWGDCLKKCREKSGCKGWTWISAGGDGYVGLKKNTCLLKTAAGAGRTVLKGFHSGTLACEGKR